MIGARRSSALRSSALDTNERRTSCRFTVYIGGRDSFGSRRASPTVARGDMAWDCGSEHVAAPRGSVGDNRLQAFRVLRCPSNVGAGRLFVAKSSDATRDRTVGSHCRAHIRIPAPRPPYFRWADEQDSLGFADVDSSSSQDPRPAHDANSLRGSRNDARRSWRAWTFDHRPAPRGVLALRAELGNVARQSRPPIFRPWLTRATRPLPRMAIRPSQVPQRPITQEVLGAPSSNPEPDDRRALSDAEGERNAR
jgi:hypothetical protein